MDIYRREQTGGLMDVKVDASLMTGKSEVGDEEANFMLVKVDNDEEEKMNAVSHRITPDNGLCDVKGGLSDFRDDEYAPKTSIGPSSDALETKSGVLEHAVLRTGQEVDSAKCSAPVYQSFMTEFDEYVANEKFSQIGTSRALRYGLEVGDMVWGKVKSHPWWPGHIFNEALASTSVRRVRGDGSVLVAFFGDSSYGWFDPAELIPFDANFADKSKQTTSRNFAKAVEEAMDETGRRSALGLVCKCRSKFNFRPSNLQGYYSVDVPDYELEGFYSAAQIKKSRDSFVPSENLSFIKKLAVTPQNSDETNLGFIKHRAISFAYRKAVFEEFDETYAQAFGGPVVIPSHDTSGATDQPIKVPTRAPLSGPLVIAEALGGIKKTPSKPMKVKDHSKKDKYLFKRRDELNTDSSVPAAYVQSSSAAAEGGYVLQKRLPSMPLNPGPLTNSGQDVLIILNGDTPSTNTKISLEKIRSFQGSKEKLGVKRAALGINRVEDGNGDRVVVKKKKVAKQTVKEVGIDPVTGEKRKKKRKELSLEAGDELPPQKRLAIGKIRPDMSAQVDHPALRTDPGLKKDEGSGSNMELPQLLCELQSLALDHFHAPEKVSSAVVRQSFLRFRSVVYQKSLILSPSVEQDVTVDVPTAKPLSVKRPPLDRKRPPADRQEDIGAKRLKNMNKMKLLSDKKPIPIVQKLKETAPQQEKNVKKLPPQQEKIVKRLPPQQQPKKAAVPTMLIMKFPPQTSLPSVAELKARFARFGPLDYSSLRVFWKSYTCRVVFQHKPDAVSAYKYAVGNGSLFGNVNVRYFVREVEQGLEAAEMPAQINEFDRSSPFQPVVQPPVQLKSCLKKPGEDPGPSKARVKFILGSEESPSRSSNPSLGDVVSSSSTTTSGPGLVVNSKNFQKSTVLPPLLPLPPKFHNNGPHQTPSSDSPSAEILTRSRPSVDISQQMISLLNRCNEVVADLTGTLGYVPYHPL